MHFAHPDLLRCLESGATVVLPTPLVADVIIRQYAGRQMENGRRSWPRPSVFSLAAWLQQTWRDARSRWGDRVPLLLTPAQEQVLWEAAIRRDGARVLDLGGTARAAMKAASLVFSWQLPLDHPAWTNDRDTESFHRWLGEVRDRCDRERWVCSFELPSRAPDWCSSNAAGREILFTGFDEPYPGIVAMAERLRNRGWRAGFLSNDAKPAQVLACECIDFDAELELAARWARARLEDEPNASIAVFVNGLAEHRLAVGRAFGSVLCPGSIVEPVNKSYSNPEPLFLIHSAGPLSSVPVVSTALALLDLLRPRVPMHSITAVLSSPFIAGWEVEQHERAMADAGLRRLRDAELPLAAVERGVARLPQLSRLWTQMSQVRDQLPEGEHEPAIWSGYWRSFLKAAGWPGNIEHSKLECDALAQWNQVLAAFDGLMLTAGKLSGDRALGYLRALVATEGPVSGTLGSPVQILDAANAPPLEWDYIFIAGASEESWSPGGLPPAFIPYSLLRDGNYPGATPATRRDLGFELTSRLQRSAPHVAASFSQSEGGSARLSCLFQPYRLVTADELYPWRGKRVLEQIASVDLECIEDTSGPPLAPEALQSGGTHVLKSQSACPFQAFARWRLRADELDTCTYSFDARDRGNFVHDALAAIWREVKTSERLRQLSGFHLLQIVTNAVKEVLSTDDEGSEFRAELRKAEELRLIDLLLEWLDIEKQRKTAFTVRHVEESTEFKLSQLVVRVRVDRVDELPDGKLIVIDYKTGKVTRGDLNNERPREPQLLTYAAMLGTQVDGLYFASIRRGECGAVGYGRLAHLDPKGEIGPELWTEQTSTWAATVKNLAQEFERGYAPVWPQKHACKYCSIKPVCRISENNIMPAEDEG